VYRSGIPLVIVALVHFGDRIRPKTLGLVQRVGHRNDVVGRRRLQLVDKIHDSRQFRDDIVDFPVVEFQASEHGYVLNLFLA